MPINGCIYMSLVNDDTILLRGIIITIINMKKQCIMKSLNSLLKQAFVSFFFSNEKENAQTYIYMFRKINSFRYTYSI